jgi:hypothetical protein
MIFSAVLGDSGSIRVDHGDITIPSLNNCNYSIYREKSLIPLAFFRGL